MLKQIFKNRKAQSIMEYTIVLGTIVLIMFAMGPAVKRGTQALIKVVADQIGNQANSDQAFDRSGHLEKSYVTTRSTVGKRTEDFLGVTNYIYSDATYTESTSLVNQGFVER